MLSNFTEVKNEIHKAPDILLSDSLDDIRPEYKGILAGTDKWIELACSVAADSVQKGGGPFGAVILQIDQYTDKILRFWTASNSVVEENDPTAHAEVLAIRSACRSLGVFNLGEIEKQDSLLEQPGTKSYCVIYSSCEPCPMCYAAISWARIPALYFAASRFDAAQPGIDFSDLEFYKELDKSYKDRTIKVCKCNAPNSTTAFEEWKRSEHTGY